MKKTLKELRLEKGFSIEYVANYMGKTSIAIRNWETMQARPDKANMKMLSELYGTKPDLISVKS